jgi:pimeloyl-ACP methyl ester carboxylesterase
MPASISVQSLRSSFDDKEPYIPATAFNGLEDLGRDVITPFMVRMTRAGNRPVLKIYPNLGEIQVFFEWILAQTFGVSEGVWIDTPFNLNRERESGELERRMPEIRQPHLVLWGDKDGWIQRAELKQMADAMPKCRLVVVPGVGHSMNLEQPALYAGYFGAWFGGLAADAVYRSKRIGC